MKVTALLTAVIIALGSTFAVAAPTPEKMPPSEDKPKVELSTKTKQVACSDAKTFAKAVELEGLKLMFRSEFFADKGKYFAAVYFAEQGYIYIVNIFPSEGRVCMEDAIMEPVFKE